MPSLDLSTYLADDALTLPGVVSEKHPRGKSYTIASPSAKTALRLQRVMQLRQASGPDAAPPAAEQIAELAELLTDDEGAPVDFHVKLMGATYQQMLDDGVSAENLGRITTLVVTYYGVGSAVAEALVKAADDAMSQGKPQAPNRAARRSGAKAGRKSAQASTATATPTRRRGSTGSSTSPNGPEGQAKAV